MTATLSLSLTIYPMSGNVLRSLRIALPDGSMYPIAAWDLPESCRAAAKALAAHGDTVMVEVEPRWVEAVQRRHLSRMGGRGKGF